MLAIGNKTDRKPLVYFIGLSAKPMCEHLAPETRTGNIIEQIIHHLPSVKAVKTNLVKTPPIDQEGKLRYPNPNEMKLGWNELQDEMNRTSPDSISNIRAASFVFFTLTNGCATCKTAITFMIFHTNRIYHNLNLIFSLFIIHRLFLFTVEKTSRTMLIM